MVENKMPALMALIPGMFYTFVVTSYIFHAKIGFNLAWEIAYAIGGVLTLAYAVALVIYGRKIRKRMELKG